MADFILSNPVFVEYILPALLVFVILFAILEKSKMLGDGKRQINAIVSLFIALIFMAFPFARGIVIKLVPFLVVLLVILFVFMLLFGFVTNKTGGDMLNNGLKITLGIIVGVAVIIAVLWATGWWEPIYKYTVEGESSGAIFANIVIVALIAAALALVLATGGKGGDKTSSSTHT